MHKKVLIFLLIIAASITAKAQTDSAVYNRYVDLNLAVLEGRQYDAIALAETIVPDTAKLPAKTRVNFYNIAGKLFDDDKQSAKAITYYQRVIAAEPDYYVAHRALGYLYLKQVEAARAKLNASQGNKEAAAEYRIAANKALPHLEKAQACDASEETLAVITSLYKNIKDTAGLDSLNSRLAKAAKNCIDILEAR